MNELNGCGMGLDELKEFKNRISKDKDELQKEYEIMMDCMGDLADSTPNIVEMVEITLMHADEELSSLAYSIKMIEEEEADE